MWLFELFEENNLNAKNMRIINTAFKDLRIIAHKSHSDSRGSLRETYNKKIINWDKFIFEYTTISKKNVLRGMHFQFNRPQGKHISVIKGKIFDVAIDLRKNSTTFGKTFNKTLSEKNKKSLYIPAGFAHGFLTLSEENIVCYSCTEYRSIGTEYSLVYNDPTLKIKWPRKKIIITKKDKLARKLSELIRDKVI